MVSKCYMKVFVNDDPFALEKELNEFIGQQMVRASPVVVVPVDGKPKFFCFTYYMGEKPVIFGE